MTMAFISLAFQHSVRIYFRAIESKEFFMGSVIEWNDWQMILEISNFKKMYFCFKSNSKKIRSIDKHNVIVDGCFLLT